MATRNDQEAIAVRPTAFFEGGRPTGNFDGAGWSCGTVQFNFGQGTLQPVFKMMHANGPQTFEECLPDGMAAELLRVCDLPVSEAVAWADARSCGEGKAHVVEPWNSALLKLWEVPGFAAADRHFCAPYLSDARNDASFYGVQTVRGLAFFFDVAVQNGTGKLGENAKQTISDAFHAKGGFALEPHKKLEALAEVVRDACNPRWASVVYDRKHAIAAGSGTVYGDPINVDERFGISDEELA